jgi:hypothetical protein
MFAFIFVVTVLKQSETVSNNYNSISYIKLKETKDDDDEIFNINIIIIAILFHKNYFSFFLFSKETYAVHFRKSI